MHTASQTGDRYSSGTELSLPYDYSYEETRRWKAADYYASECT